MVNIKLFQSILDGLIDPVTVIDLEYRLHYFNQKRAEILEEQLTRRGEKFIDGGKNMLGRLCFEATYEEEKPCLKCTARAVLVTKRPCVLEKQIEYPPGELLWLENRGYPLFDERGKFSHVMIIGHDVTANVKSRERRSNYIGELERSLSQIASSAVDDNNSSYLTAPADLTSREVEVLRLIVEGFTNVEISQILCISAHTVKSHVINIFNKIGVKDRTQAAVWAVRQNMA